MRPEDRADAHLWDMLAAAREIIDLTRIHPLSSYVSLSFK